LLPILDSGQATFTTASAIMAIATPRLSINLGPATVGGGPVVKRENHHTGIGHAQSNSFTSAAFAFG